MILAGAEAIVLTPCDVDKMVPVIHQAIINNVKVVAVDSRPSTNLISGYVGSDNYQGGLLAAQKMSELLGEKGSIIVLCHPMRNNSATREREIAFLEGVQVYGPHLKIVSAEKCGTATVQGDYNALDSLLTKFPTAKGVYCVTGSCLDAVLQVSAKKQKDSLIVVGWDPTASSWAALKQGRIRAVLMQDAWRMGYLGVQLAHQALLGYEDRKVHEVQVQLLTQQKPVLKRP
jgi:ribose transport system substrate-binding protein